MSLSEALVVRQADLNLPRRAGIGAIVGIPPCVDGALAQLRLQGARQTSSRVMASGKLDLAHPVAENLAEHRGVGIRALLDVQVVRVAVHIVPGVWKMDVRDEGHTLAWKGDGAGQLPLEV